MHPAKVLCAARFLLNRIKSPYQTKTVYPAQRTILNNKQVNLRDSFDQRFIPKKKKNGQTYTQGKAKNFTAKTL